MSHVKEGGRELRSPSTLMCKSSGSLAFLFAFFGINLILSFSITELMSSWKGPFVRERDKKIWLVALICLLWVCLEGEKLSCFWRRGAFSTKMKNSFVYVLWFWAKALSDHEGADVLCFWLIQFLFIFRGWYNFSLFIVSFSLWSPCILPVWSWAWTIFLNLFCCCLPHHKKGKKRRKYLLF